jgi:hypothetical protein
MTGLTVRERSRVVLLAVLRGERWGQVISVSEAERVVRCRRVLVERVVSRRVPVECFRCEMVGCGGGVSAVGVRHVLVHAGDCSAGGQLCDPAGGCGISRVCQWCALRVAGVVV